MSEVILTLEELLESAKGLIEIDGKTIKVYNKYTGKWEVGERGVPLTKAQKRVQENKKKVLEFFTVNLKETCKALGLNYSSMKNHYLKDKEFNEKVKKAAQKTAL